MELLVVCIMVLLILAATPDSLGMTSSVSLMGCAACLDQVVDLGAAIIDVHHDLRAKVGRARPEVVGGGARVAAVDRQVVVGAVGRKDVLCEQLLAQARLSHLQRIHPSMSPTPLHPAEQCGCSTRKTLTCSL